MSVLVNELGVRDAADIDFTVAVACLNQKLSGYPLPFTLVSRDHFVHLLKKRIDELSYRKCLVYHPSKVINFLHCEYENLKSRGTCSSTSREISGDQRSSNILKPKVE
jgi:hypothetical protein